MFTKACLRGLLLMVGSIYVTLIVIYTYHTQLPNVFMAEKRYRWLNEKINSHLNIDNEGVRTNDFYLRNLREYKNGIIEIDETKVIETKHDVTIYRSHKENNRRSNLDETDSAPQRKYLFALRHYEQLAASTKNLLSLASLATHLGMNTVMPFVNNSRFSGFRLGLALSRHMKLRKSNISEDDFDGFKFSNLSSYFDVDHFQHRLASSGYTKMVPFSDFRQDCTTIDVVMHFLYNDKKSREEIMKRSKLTETSYDAMKDEAARNGGIVDCNFLANLNVQRYLDDIPVKRYVCIDPDIVTKVKFLKDHLIKDSKCVAIHTWRGSGIKRTNFDSPRSITKTLVPSDLRHNKKLIDIAYHFIREVIKRPFISVHVRSERHLMWKTTKELKHCIKKLADKVRKRKSKFNLKKIFLANDLEETGSGTLKSSVSDIDRKMLKNFLYESLGQTYRFDPNAYELYDRGQVAIVEMHILSLGESFFTLGRGNFQEWISDLFLLHNADDKSLIYKTCELGK